MHLSFLSFLMQGHPAYAWRNPSRVPCFGIWLKQILYCQDLGMLLKAMEILVPLDPAIHTTKSLFSPSRPH